MLRAPYKQVRNVVIKLMRRSRWPSRNFCVPLWENKTCDLREDFQSLLMNGWAKFPSRFEGLALYKR